MILIAISVLILIVSSLFMSKLSHDVYGASIVLSVMLVTVGLTFPLSGYSETTIQTECELMPLIENTDTYVIKTNKGSYICKHNELVNKTESADIKEYDSKVKIEIDDNISKPVLKIYSKKAKRSWWTFALGEDKEEIVIHVSQDNIID